MTSKFLTTVAAGAVFATASVLSPAAFAQTATQPSATAPATTTTPATTDAAGGAAASTPTGSYLTEQSPDQVSANTYIGQSVYNGANESIGSVSDLIMQKQGGIVAAVVGVGGFLGIGAKNVAVPIANISVAQNKDGTVRLTTSESVDSLKAAPEYKTLAMQSSQSAPNTMSNGSSTSDGSAAPATGTGTGTGTGTAPANGGAAGSTTAP